MGDFGATRFLSTSLVKLDLLYSFVALCDCYYHRLPWFCLISHFRHGAPPHPISTGCVLPLRRCFLLSAWACSFVPSFPEAPCTFSSLGPQFGFPRVGRVKPGKPVASGWSGLRSSIAATRTTWLCSWCTCCGSDELSGQTHCVP